MSAHTPGPWFVVPGTLGAIEAANGVRVANTEQTRPVRSAEDNLERMANASLLAGAPALLASLQNLVGLAKMRGGNLHEYGAAIADAEAAIAKATA